MISLLLSLFYYQYHIIITEEIRELAASDVKSNIEIQIHDLAKLLDENIDSILDNLKIVANQEKLENQEIRKSELAGLTTDASTDLGDSYIWINKDGEIVWSSDSKFYLKLSEEDTKNQEFFYTPKNTLKPSIGRMFLDSKYTNLEGWYVSYPIIAEKEIPTSDYSDKDNENNSPQLQGITQDFNGVVMALIDAETLGQFLQQKIPEKYDALINLFDMDGNIVYSTDPFFMTKDIHSLDMDNPLVTNIHNSVISLLNSSFYNDNSVVYDIPERKVSIAYQPVYLDYTQHKQEQKYQPFTILSLSATHQLANDVSYLLEQERLFSILIIVSIFIVSISIALIIVTWNKKLKNMVKLKTLQLRQSNKDLQLSNRQLKLHDKMQKDFINIAAHELRTPVQVISGYTEMIIEDIKKYVSEYIKIDKTNMRNDNNETTNEISIMLRMDDMVKAIDRNSSRLYKLTSDLIDVIQIEQNKLELKKDKFDLNENIEGIITDFKKLKFLYDNNLKDVEIIFEKSETSIIVVGDRIRISQVIFNLLSNSLKSTQTGKIIVSIYKRKKNGKYITNGPANIYDNSSIRDKKIQLISKYNLANDYDDNSSEYEIIVVVKDTGSGLSSEIESNLFGKFSSKSEKGIGLGLYISKKIIEAHNGNIWAENNHDCNGTTFTFTLPLK